jgi:hypothetical protein
MPEIGQIYSFILAEIHDLNFVIENTIIDDRTLVERIGAGGYGTVFKARTKDGNIEALKIFHTSNFEQPELVDRLCACGKREKSHQLAG